MGCHTWTYEEITLDKLNLEKMKETIIKNNLDNIQLYKELIFEYQTEKEKVIKEDFEGREELFLEDFKLLKKEIKNRKNIIKLINQGKLNKKRKLLKLFSETEDFYYIFDNKLFKEVNDFNDLFRTDYSTQVLHNLEETFDFLRDNCCFGNSYFSEECNKIVTEYINIERIKEFWKKYPNGLINFG